MVTVFLGRKGVLMVEFKLYGAIKTSETLKILHRAIQNKGHGPLTYVKVLL
jgi:hypothetical protein